MVVAPSGRGEPLVTAPRVIELPPGQGRCERIGDTVHLTLTGGYVIVFALSDAAMIGSALLRVAAGPDLLDAERPT